MASTRSILLGGAALLAGCGVLGGALRGDGAGWLGAWRPAAIALGAVLAATGLTVLLSFGFLIIKYFEYTAKFEHGLFPSTSTFLAVYFTMTGLHGLHVIGGIIVNSYLLGPGSKLWDRHPEQFTNRVEAAGLYWHFVDLVWIFLFPTLYLL